MKEDKPERQERKKEIFNKRPQTAQKIEDRPGFKGIVRLAGKDIRGHVKLQKAFTYIRGIGPTLSAAVARIVYEKFGFQPTKEVGELSDQDIENIDNVLFSIHEQKIPHFLLNRRADVLDGVDRHIIMNDLIFSTKQDVEREKKLYTWKGYRFYYGQKVRGQRTRNSGRTGMTVGVLRKAVIAAQQAQKEAPGKPGAAGAEKPAGGAAPAGGTAKPAEKPAAKPAEKK